MSTWYLRALSFCFIGTFIAMVLLLVPVTVTPVSAGTSSVTYCGIHPTGDYPYVAGTVVTLPRWDKTALGIPSAILSSVDVTAVVHITQTFAAENTGSIAGNLSGKQYAGLDVYSPNNPYPGGPAVLSSLAFNNVVIHTLAASDDSPNPPDFAGPDYYMWPTAHMTRTSTASDSPVSTYIGSGNVDFTIDGTAYFVAQGGSIGNIVQALTTDADVTVCVIYSYSSTTAVTLSSMTANSQTQSDSIPAEPIALAGVIGFAGLGWMAVKRRRIS